MEKGKLVKILAVTALATVFMAAGLWASSCPEIITMKNAAYSSHTKGIVEFTHAKHYRDYGAKCGDCHHDKDGKPLADLKEGDAVEGCIACHSKPGEMPKDEKKELKGLSKEEKTAREMAYHAEALHENCKNCHKEWNKANGKKANEGAPTSCTACHPK